MVVRKEKEIKGIYFIISLLFIAFLAIPILRLLGESFLTEGGVSLQNYFAMLQEKGFLTAFGNSVKVSICASAISTGIGFFLAYTIHYTNLPRIAKKWIRVVAVLPMLLPTITYGFAILYSFGKLGLLTKLFGRQLFEIYGFGGLLFGYVIYTMPVAFLLMLNAMEFIDKKFMVVSRVMGDSPRKTFYQTILRPLLGTLAASMVQCFFLCFTDYGIPASVGGKYQVVATVLYNEMLGSIPNFGQGAAVAMLMLLPSVLSISLLHYLERYNIRYHKISPIELPKSCLRDGICGVGAAVILIGLLSIFLVLGVVPFVEAWPYQIQFTTEHVLSVLRDDSLMLVYRNSILVAALSALFGLLVTYGAALATARSGLAKRWKQMIDNIALITNTIPGMVIGIAYLLIFSGTPLQNTLLLMILCNIIHFFSTPYLMLKGALEKLNQSWETTAALMGDSWFQTIFRIVTPNMKSTLWEVFGYYFINAMVTVSAVIFLAGARTMLLTTKIKELQYYTKFNEVFVLSLLILVTNLVIKGVLGLQQHRAMKKEQEKGEKKMNKKKKFTLLLTGLLTASAFAGCGSSGAEATAKEQVVICSNADDEAVEAMKKTLDANGYEGKYLFQTFGTSELGGKVLAEGTNIEADLLTLSTFYVDSAQEKQKMFRDLDFTYQLLDGSEKTYCAPITSQEGAIIVNTELLEENDLPMPTCLKDLANPIYQDMISVTDIKSSSTAWLLIQALVDAYGENGAKEVLAAIYQNAGPHIESSGSAPLKKVRAGEVAIGFGLRQQAVADKAGGLPIDFVDPAEGNFSLTESVAVVDKGEDTNPLAQEMAKCIIEQGRSELQKYYPNALYAGETTDSANASAYPKTFTEPLTAELLEKHQVLSESCK